MVSPFALSSATRILFEPLSITLSIHSIFVDALATAVTSNDFSAYMLPTISTYHNVNVPFISVKVSFTT